MSVVKIRTALAIIAAAALELWLEDVPGMPPKGSVVGVLGGDLLKELGLIPAEAARPETR